MSRARNIADLLDANGDVATGALDNVPPSNDASALTTGTLSADRIAAGSIAAAKLAETYLTPTGDGSGLSGIASDKLIKELPVASGASITTNDALSIGAAGTVGEYPAVNNLDASTTSNSHGTVVYADRSGTRWLRITSSGSGTNNSTGNYTMFGAAYDRDAGTFTKGSDVTWSLSTGSGGWDGGSSYGYSAYPLTGTGKFIVWSGGNGNWSPDYSYIRGRTTQRIMLVTVNSNGSVSVHQSINYDSGTGNGHQVYGGKNSSGWISRKIFVTGYGTNTGSWNIRSFHINSAETGWTINDEGSDSQYMTGTGAPADTPTANGIIFIPNGFTPTLHTVSGTNLTANLTASDFSSQLSASYNSGLSFGVLPGAQKIFGRYTSSTGDLRQFTGSFDDNGAVTIIDDWIVPSTETVWGGTIYYVSDTKVAAYSSGKFNTLELNSDGTFKGYGITNYNNGNTDRLAISSDGNNVTFFSDSYANIKNMTINGWSTDPFKLVGFANADASSGNVSVAVAGIQGGFTGLTKGKNYYVNTAYDGSIVVEGSTSAGALVGCAISATEILIAGVQE